MCYSVYEARSTKCVRSVATLRVAGFFFAYSPSFDTTCATQALLFNRPNCRAYSYHQLHTAVPTAATNVTNVG